MINFINKIKSDKKGNIGLESILFGSVLVILIMFFVGYFSYLYPRYMLDMEVQQLANSAKIDGKITSQSLSSFEDSMKERGYSAKDLEQTIDKNGIKTGLYVEAVGTSTPSYFKSLPNGLIEKGQPINPVKRNDGKITITLVVPANKALLKGSGSFFGILFGKEMQNYEVKRTVMSENYGD